MNEVQCSETSANIYQSILRNTQGVLILQTVRMCVCVCVCVCVCKKSVKLPSFNTFIFDTTYWQQINIQHAQFIIKKLTIKTHKTTNILYGMVMTFGFSAKRDFRTEGSDTRMRRKTFVHRIGKVKRVWRKLQNVELLSLDKLGGTCSKNDVLFLQVCIKQIRGLNVDQDKNTVEA